jgi:hypothetical protein
MKARIGCRASLSPAQLAQYERKKKHFKVTAATSATPSRTWPLLAKIVCLQIDYRFELDRDLNRQVGGVCATQDAIDISSRPTKYIRGVGSVR